jgi:hypothetical protein
MPLKVFTIYQNLVAPFVIGEEKAGCFQYTVIKEQNISTWKIDHQGNEYTVVENQDLRILLWDNMLNLIKGRGTKMSKEKINEF